MSEEKKPVEEEKPTVQKFVVTERGAHDPDGKPVEVGQQFDKPESEKMPAWLVGKVALIPGDPKKDDPDGELKTNPAKKDGK